MPAALLSQPTLAFALESAHAAAFQEANRALHASKVDDSLSGTTAITCFVRGATLCVANVGDSRACLAEDTGKALAAINLSCDQTPFRCVASLCSRRGTYRRGQRSRSATRCAFLAPLVRRRVALACSMGPRRLLRRQRRVARAAAAC